MEALWNFPCLLYLLVTLVFHCESSTMTFTNERASFIQLENWNVSESRGLGFRFKTFMSDALLLYMDDEAKSNFLRVELFQGKLRLTCSHGSRFGAMAVEIGDHLNDLEWHRVLLERMKGQTTISLDGQSKSTVNSREKKRLSITSSMYFGGIPPKLALSKLTQPSVFFLRRFLGCLADVEMFEYSARQGKRREAIWQEENEIVAGCTNMCEIDNKCQNNATCLNKFITSDCDCTATGFTGKTCVEGRPVLGLSLSDYVTFNRSSKATSSQQDRIIFRFKTANQNGSILESGLGRDYLVIEMYLGFLLIRWNLGSGELHLHVREKACNDDKWHSVDITRNQRQLELTLDGVVRMSRTFPGRFISFNLKQGEGDVFIGGMVPSHALSSRSRSSGISFDGCLQELIFNGVDIVEGVANRKVAFRTKGRPRSNCKNARDLDSTPVTLESSPSVVTTGKTATERPTFETSTEKDQLPISFTTTPITTSKDHAIASHRIPTTHAQTVSKNLLRPCVDDEDDCDLEDSGSVGDVDSSGGETDESSGDKSTTFIDNKEYNVKVPSIITNKSAKKPVTEDSFETDGELVRGEPDIAREICIGDDEDICNNEDDSGQSSTAEAGSAGSASPTSTTLSAHNISNFVNESVQLKANSSKKWTLIAGIIVVGTLLVAFSIFAIWWLYKHRNEPYWNGSHRDKGSKERCLQAEVTDV